MTDDLPAKRDKHPYIMYDMLLESPRSIKMVISQLRSTSLPSLGEPIFVTGNGTSFHAGAIAAYPFRSFDIQPVQAFELERYLNPKGSILAISHTGKTGSSVNAVRKHSSHVRTAGISFAANSPLLKTVQYPVEIKQKPDASLCNTKATFADSIAVYMVLSHSTGYAPQKPEDIQISFEREFLSTETQVAKLTKEISLPEKIYVLGAGPNFITARETAQKIKEATHIQSEGIGLEEFNHGCTALIDDKSLLVIFSTEKVRDRESDIVSACRETRTPVLTINGTSDFNIKISYLDEDHSPYNYLAAGYFLAYYLSLKAGTNPDYLRLDNPMYRGYDNIVFPPGTH